CIEHDQIVRIDSRHQQVAHAIEQRHFLYSRHGRYQLDLALGFFQNGWTEEPGDLAFHRFDVASRFEVGIDFNSADTGITLTFLPAERPLEDIGCRVRRVRRYH